jgi:hypothetical protein
MKVKEYIAVKVADGTYANAVEAAKAVGDGSNVAGIFDGMFPINDKAVFYDKFVEFL